MTLADQLKCTHEFVSYVNSSYPLDQHNAKCIRCGILALSASPPKCDHEFSKWQFRQAGKRNFCKHCGMENPARLVKEKIQGDHVIMDDRAGKYGEPKNNWSAITKGIQGIIESAIDQPLPKDLPPQVGPLIMTYVKACREAFRHDADNIIDGRNYFTIAEKTTE